MVILASALLGLLIAMFMEYLLHRYYLHFTGKHTHIVKHHVLFRGDKSYSILDSKYNDIVSGLSYIIVNMMPNMLMAWYLWSSSKMAASALLTCGIVYTIWIESAHYLFHHPMDYAIEKNAYFLRLKEHHRIHHVVFRNNYGIGSTLIDHLFKTVEQSLKLRKTLASARVLFIEILCHLVRNHYHKLNSILTIFTFKIAS